MKKLSKKAKGILIAAAVVLAAGAVAAALYFSGVFAPKKAGSLSDERYEVVGIDFVSMTQKGTNSYDLNVTLEDRFSDSDDVKLYFSKNDTFNPEKSDELKVSKLEDGTYEVDGFTYDPGDYFLYAKAGEEIGTYPVTIPKMNPKTWMNGEAVNIEFEVDPNISWSSFIDPEGKNVYRSASPVYDKSAKAMEENIDILTSSFTDSAPSEEEPYYYIVFNGKNGKFRYISSPLFYTASQSPVEAVFYEKNGKPFLELKGTIYSVSEDAQRKLQLRVGNYNGDDPTSTFLVENSYEGGDSTAFCFKIPLKKLKAASNNLALFLTENGTMCEWSINAGGLKLEDYTLVNGDARYGLSDENALKITRMLDAFDGIQASLAMDGKKPLLKVDGTLKYGLGGEDYQLIIKATDGQEYVAENTVNEGKKFSFAFPLKQLYSAGIWYDIQIKCVDDVVYYDVASSVADMEQSLDVGEKRYTFEEYNGLLKVQYTLVKDFSELKASLSVSGGKPILSVAGTIAKTEAENLALAIRTGETVTEAENKEKEDGKFSASIDLAKMTEKDTWYDVLILFREENTYYDLSVSNADMDQTAQTGKNYYSFKEWEGQLKVNYSDPPLKLLGMKAEIRTSGDRTVMTVTGTAAEDASSYRLGLRNEGKVAAVFTNKGTGKKLKYQADLSLLKKSGAWYDIIIGHSGFEDAVDLTTDAADMDTKVTSGKRIYKFAEWDGQLKVYYDKVLTDIKGVKAEITGSRGRAYLVVTGTMKGAADKFLGIRTEDVIIRTKNTGKGDRLKFKFNLAKLKKPGIWYDVIIGTEGSDEYRDLTTSSADMSQTLTVGKKIYSFKEYERALKVTCEYVAEDLKNVKASITAGKSGKPVLKVSGKMNGASSMYLGLRTGDTIIKAKNRAKGNKLSFNLDLTKLESAGTWYDVIIGNGTFETYKDVTVASADMSDSVSYDGSIYKFADYNHQLKVYFEAEKEDGFGKGKEITDVHAVLILKDGKPVLRIQGKMKGIKPSALELGIRTGDTVLSASNITGTENRFMFDFDLEKLTKSGTWYDIVLIESASGGYVDVNVKAVYSTGVTVTYRDNVYRLADYEGDLKVYFTNNAEEEAKRAKIAANFKNVTAKIESASGKPVLKVTADIGALANKDVTLNVRSGDTTVKVKNASSTEGKFSGTVDLTGLKEKAVWYDVYWYVDSEGMEINLGADQADMSSNCSYNGFTYQFKEWNSQLKVEFE